MLILTDAAKILFGFLLGTAVDFVRKWRSKRRVLSELRFELEQLVGQLERARSARRWASIELVSQIERVLSIYSQRDLQSAIPRSSGRAGLMEFYRHLHSFRNLLSRPLHEASLAELVGLLPVALEFSEFSPLKLSDQLPAAQTRFDSLAARAKAGEAEAAEVLEVAGLQLLTVARASIPRGSEGYRGIYEQVSTTISEARENFHWGSHDRLLSYAESLLAELPRYGA